MIRFASLGSGSRGNASLVMAGDACIMVDCGFSVAETRRRLARLSVEPEQLTAIVVTHEHSDHASGVGRAARAFSVPVFATRGTARACVGRWGRNVDLRLIDSRAGLTLADVEVEAVTVPHDASEPCQFLFRHRGQCLGVLTDLGHVSELVAERYRSCDLLVLEANHDEKMLSAGPYPPALKARVGGAWGHLSNRQARRLLAGVDHGRLQQLVLAHLSEKNNTIDLAVAAVMDTGTLRAAVSVATQDGGLQWHRIY